MNIEICEPDIVSVGDWIWVVGNVFINEYGDIVIVLSDHAMVIKNK